MLERLRRRAERFIETPRNQIIVFTWAWRLALAMVVAGYAIMAYLLADDLL